MVFGFSQISNYKTTKMLYKSDKDQGLLRHHRRHPKG